MQFRPEVQSLGEDSEEVGSQASERTQKRRASERRRKLRTSDACHVLPPSWALGEEVENFEEGIPLFVQLGSRSAQEEKERVDTSTSYSDSTACSSSGGSCVSASLEHDSGGYGKSFKRPSLQEVSVAALKICFIKEAMGLALLVDVNACLEQASAASCAGGEAGSCAGGAHCAGAGVAATWSKDRSHAALGENQRRDEAHGHDHNEGPSAASCGGNEIADKLRPLAELYQPLFSIEQSHPDTCFPCSFFAAKRGCRNSTTCSHCHHEDHCGQSLRADYHRRRRNEANRHRNLKGTPRAPP